MNLLRRIKPRKKDFNFKLSRRLVKKQEIESLFNNILFFTPIEKAKNLKKNQINPITLSSTKSAIEFNFLLNKSFPFNLDLFVVIKTVINTGTFKRASEILFLSQPSISLQIKKLEKLLDFQIFDRAKKPLQLTNIGKIFLYYGDRILFLSEEILKILFSLKKHEDDILLFNKNTKPLKQKIFFYSNKNSIKLNNLKNIFQIYKIKKDLNLKIYSFLNLNLFIAQNFNEKQKSLKRNLTEIKFLFLTDEIFFLGKNQYYQNNRKKRNLMIHQIEITTIKALSFCLKTKLANSFIIENSMFDLSM